MRKTRSALQGDLFDSSGESERVHRMRELDTLIARAVKKRDFALAKQYAREQKQLITTLVNRDGES